MPEHRIAALLASFPRSRPPLTTAQEAHYADEYRRNRAGSKGLFAITAALESWMHRSAAASQPAGAILELGAGNLNHVPYESGASSYDAVEPFAQLWHDSPYRSSVGAIYQDIAEIEPARRFDRIVSIAVLEHLTDLPLVVAQCGLRLAPGGRFQAGIPTEGGFLWGLAWRATTGVAYRLRRGDNYGRIMRHEHVNDAREIRAVVEYFFPQVTLRRFPLPFFHLSFYTYLEAALPDVDRCSAFCRSRSVAENQ